MEHPAVSLAVPRRRDAVRLAAFFSSAAIVMSIGAGAAVAAPISPVPDEPVFAAFVDEVGVQTIDNQEAILDLRAWMSEQPGFADSGYVGSIDDLPNKATTIMWHGARTRLLAAVIAEGARRGIRVSVQPRRYSLQQLEAAVDAIWQQEAEGVWAGFKISTIEAVGAVEDGLTVTGSHTSATTAAAARARPLPAAVNGIPVQVKPGAATTAQVGRTNDFAPFYGGGFMISPSTNGLCSNGFTVKINGVARTTTARHCWPDDYQSRDASGTTHQYGAGVAAADGVRALSSAGMPYIFRGRPDQTGIVSPVRGTAAPGINMLICTSGGNSGEHCNIKISSLFVSWNDGAGPIWTMQGDQQTPGAITSMQGDSGGPVFTAGSDGRVRAVGMIQAGVQGTLMVGSACGPARDYGEPFRGGQALSCSTSFLFTPLRAMTDALNAQLWIVP